ncbi:WSC domain-containing protein [Rhypophila decipiens]|uniref:WSC domain-containing protein n=1 Tax=Rhypophila decipiens TaxID=261697 RepID=A0AAN7B2J0_9PEZI|nr:WSC domain-containing protein [Rhypophila decipiens]
MQRTITIIAAAAALSALGVNCSPLQATELRRRDMPVNPGYDFAGCYTEATSARALTGASYFDDHMTIQKCATACSVSGFKYFGVEYGRECYCGDSLNAGSTIASISDCSFTCPGDSTSNCGAGNRLSMYIRSDPYSYLGCYAEPDGGRALTGEFTFTDDLTVAKCATFCHDFGYSYFGLEYYFQCYCGYTIATGAASAPEGDCSFPCPGDASEKCGGDWRLNLYQFVSAPAPTVPSYTSEGCYTEATGMRALTGASFFNDLLTVEKCAAACVGYTWFGLEYGRECYCGNTINTGSVPTSIGDCSFNCPGNSAEKCGAGDRLNMYSYVTATPSPSSVPPASSVVVSSPVSSTPAASSSAVSSSAESSAIPSAPVISSSSVVPSSSAISSSSVISEPSVIVSSAPSP